MLELLRIKNLAVIESISVDFTQGLNLLTGETGAGKSIILKSISFLGGTKISTDLIRTNSESCEVEGLFAINNTQENREKLSTILDSDTQSFDQSDLEKNSSDIIEIIIRRTLDKNGRSRIFINDKLSTI